MAAPKKIDYERIEPGWRAGLLSPHQLAAAYTEETGQKVSHAAIIKHFKKAGIARDLSAKIRDRAEAMVTEAMVTGKVTPRQTIPDATLIEEGSTQVATVRLAHRKDIHRARRLTNALLDELERQTDPETVALLSEFGALMRNPDDKGADKLNDLYHAIISLPERSKTLKVLTESLQKLVDMERQAFGMDKDQPKSADALTDLLMRISNGSGSGIKPVATDPERDDD
ncbi:MAG: hypothetical protein WC322_00110 [Candidatus Paceibacterota bacterium]|jgi:hypothetical protein